MRPTRARLLEAAGQVLDGTVPLGHRSARIAAVLTRAAFEDWLDQMSASWSSTAGRGPTTASKLVVLRAFRGDAVADDADRAWHQLSRLCHHQAYELQPNLIEVGDMLALVRSLSAE